MNNIRAAVIAVWIVIFISGCSSSKTTSTEQIQKETIAEQQKNDRAAAMQLFIDGSLKESKGQFAEAILDYQDALRFDRDPAILYALAKNYAGLKRYVPAIEHALEAVKLDSAKIDYRELLGQIYIHSGQFDKAAQTYRSILTIDPNHVNSLFALAQIMERSRPLESLELYERILQRQGPSWEILLQVAQLNTVLQRYDKATEAYEQMLKLDPSNIAVKQSLADMYMRQKQYDKAIATVNDVLEKNPKNLFLRATLVDVYLQQNDWKSARNEMETILAADSLDPDLHFRIGLAYYSQALKDSSLFNDAITVFKKFEKDYPTDWRPYLYLGVLHRQLKQDSVAENYLNKATTSANWNADAWWQLGWLYFDKQDFMETTRILNKAKMYVPDDFRIHMLLGIAYNRAGMNEDSRVALERAHELNPADINVLSSLGLTYDALKMHTESDSVYEKALRIDPDYALVLNNYAYSLSERNIQLDRAMKMSKRSLEKDSANSSYLDTYGWILYQLGRYEDALVYIKKSIESGDASSVVLEHLGDVYAKLNRIDEAKKYWTKALDKDQKNSALRQKIERGAL
ncbi:MAG: tetratricopeptide repeat protein [Ignavibacteriales bacterium]|nr:tetratricopeptide repeat protein [Ignavibacteriales bacterium]